MTSFLYHHFMLSFIRYFLGQRVDFLKSLIYLLVFVIKEEKGVTLGYLIYAYFLFILVFILFITQQFLDRNLRLSRSIRFITTGRSHAISARHNINIKSLKKVYETTSKTLSSLNQRF